MRRLKAQLGFACPPKKTQARASRRNPSLVGRERFVVARSDASRRAEHPFRRRRGQPRFQFFGRIITLYRSHPNPGGGLTNSLPLPLLRRSPATNRPRTRYGFLIPTGSQIVPIARREKSEDNHSPGRENQARLRPAFPDKASDGRRLESRRQAFPPPPVGPRGRQSLNILAPQGVLRPAAFPSARSTGKESPLHSLSRSDLVADLDRS